MKNSLHFLMFFVLNQGRLFLRRLVKGVALGARICLFPYGYCVPCSLLIYWALISQMNFLIEKPSGQWAVTNGANRLGPRVCPYLVQWLRANLWASFPLLENKEWLIWMGFRISLGSYEFIIVKFWLLGFHTVCVPASLGKGPLRAQVVSYSSPPSTLTVPSLLHGTLSSLQRPLTTYI